MEVSMIRGIGALLAVGIIFPSFCSAQTNRPSKNADQQAGQSSNSERSAELTQEEPIEPTEQQKLLAAISGEYRGGGSTPSFKVRVKHLEELKAARDPQVKEIAKLAVGINALYALINKQADFSAEGRILMAQVIASALTADDAPRDSLQEAAEIVNTKGGAIDQSIERVRRIMNQGDEIQKSQNALRRAVKRLVSKPRLPQLDAEKDFAILFKPGAKAAERLTTSSRGYLSIKNNTGRLLPAVTCIVDVHMSDDLIDKAIAQEKQRAQVPSAISVLLGIDPELQGRSLDNARRYYERLRLGYGMMIYVPSLKPGATVTFDFATLGDIDHVVDAVGVLIVSDGVGSCTTDLDVPEMKMKLEKAVLAQMNKGKKQKRK